MKSLQINIPSTLTNESLLQLLVQSVDMIMEKAKVTKETIIGIGIGMHGLVDPFKGVSLFAPNFHLRNIPIKEELERVLGIPVQVENDVRAMALSESWFGQGVGVDNFICINVGVGIGAGLVLDNKLYRGASHTSGEVGHTTIVAKGPKCSCGNYGCLQMLASGPAIALRARKSISMSKSSKMEELCGGNLDLLSGETIYQAALQKDELAIKILQNTGKYLGIAIANVINIMNPSRVIIGGGVSKSGDFILDTLKQTVNQRALDTPAKATDIVITRLGDHVTAIGAATLILQKLFIPDYTH